MDNPQVAQVNGRRMGTNLGIRGCQADFSSAEICGNLRISVIN